MPGAVNTSKNSVAIKKSKRPNEPMAGGGGHSPVKIKKREGTA